MVEYYKFGIFLSVAIVVVSIIYAIIKQILINEKNKSIREEISENVFISAQRFENNWIVHRKGNKGLSGFKYNDGPGCYIIVIFDEEVTDNNYLNYDEIYIGQSTKVCQRVHNHFNGKGNGDVYADLKYGKYVYVQFISCEKYEMNEIEKMLIKAFNATKSYNNTKGGS